MRRPDRASSRPRARAAGTDEGAGPLPIGELLLGLHSVFPATAHIEVVERRPASHVSSFSAELVRARVGADELRLFCKYGETDLRDPQSHRRGLAYESFVYKAALAGHRPRRIGRFTTDRTDCLVLEHLDGACLLRHCGLDDYVRAARWLGRFHRRHANISAGDRLTVYGPRMFERRVDELTAHPEARTVPWLRGAAGKLSRMLAPLTEAPTTLLHGEYFPGNILLLDGDVVPVDWETAGVGPAELDMGAFTWGWDPPSSRLLEEAYAAERTRPGGAGTSGERLRAGRTFVLVQSLAESRTWREPRTSRALAELGQLLDR
jgi:Phosphotransferase enzyme family